jgi:hypothetical protein
MATEAPYVLAPEAPAAEVPTFKDTASDIIGSSVSIAKTARDMAPPAPTSEEMRAANQKADEARAEYRKRLTSYDESVKPQIEDYKLAAQKYAADAQEKIPQQRAIPAPPKMGLRPFLASTKDEAPESTIAKFMQAMSLFATMAGGGRAGARASLSALTGAMEGWRDGNRWKADKDYQTWKDTTEAMFRSFDDEMRAYNSLMVAERVPLEQKWRALELTAREHRNAMLAEEFNVTDTERGVAVLEKARDARQRVEMEFAKAVAAKEVSDQHHQLALKTQELNFNYRLEHLAIERKRLQQMDEVALTGETLERLANERASGVAWNDLVRGFGKGVIPRMTEIENRATAILTQAAGGLNADPNTLRMINKMQLESDKKALEDLAKKQAVWETYALAFEPAVERMLMLANKVDDRTGMPVFDKWLLRSRMQYAGDEDVKALDRQMEIVAMESARVITRQGLTNEATQKKAREDFDMSGTPAQLKRVVDEVLRPDAENARQGFEQYKKAIIERVSNRLKPKTPGEAAAPGAVPTPKPAEKPAETLSRKSSLYQKARSRGLTDEQIKSQYGVTVTD